MKIWLQYVCITIGKGQITFRCIYHWDRGWCWEYVSWSSSILCYGWRRVNNTQQPRISSVKAFLKGLFTVFVTLIKIMGLGSRVRPNDMGSTQVSNFPSHSRFVRERYNVEEPWYISQNIELYYSSQSLTWKQQNMECEHDQIDLVW